MAVLEFDRYYLLITPSKLLEFQDTVFIFIYSYCRFQILHPAVYIAHQCSSGAELVHGLMGWAGPGPGWTSNLET